MKPVAHLTSKGIAMKIFSSLPKGKKSTDCKQEQGSRAETSRQSCPGDHHPGEGRGALAPST
jgi:hypothetical protein